MSTCGVCGQHLLPGMGHACSTVGAPRVTRIARHVKTQPVQEFQRAPNDIMIKRVADGVVRTKEDALAIARRRDRTVTYKGSDVRWFCFAPGRRR